MMTKEELAQKLVDAYTNKETIVTASLGVFTFTYGEYVVDVYSPTELMEAAHAINTNVKTRYAAELNAAFAMYRYFKANPTMFALARKSFATTNAIHQISTEAIAKQYAYILSSIRTKPFILLAGISGTGKSRMVRQLARGCCPRFMSGTEVDHPLYDPKKPGNFEMIQVRPNWHDSTELMGYESRVSGKAEFVVKPFLKFLAKAWLYEEEGIPFFLCLDEMNLAPVEQYFAEYLSIIETRKAVDGKIVTDPLVTFPNEELRDQILDGLYAEKTSEVSKIMEMFKKRSGIPIPQNFIVMGTVNMDETTFSFSRKVLDRAMSFELNEVDMDGGLGENPDCEYGSISLEHAKCEFTQGYEVYAVAQEDCDKIKAFLVEVNKVLDKTPFKIAYRTRDEVMIYCHERLKDGVSLARALDEATSMKILSRIEGDKRRLVVRDGELGEFNGKNLLDALQDVIGKGLAAVGNGEGDGAESNVCAKKLQEMNWQLDSGYTSFWTR